MNQTRALVLVSLAALGIFPAEVAAQRSVKRGQLERQGRAWAERASCAATVREGGRLVLRTDFGSVVVRKGASDRMECQVVLKAYTSSAEEARRYFENYELNVRTLEGGGVYLVGTSGSERGPTRLMGAEYNITVPQRFNVDIETQGGDIDVESSLQGEVRATTAAGDIRVGDVSGPLKVETAGGSIALGNIGQRAVARTAGGSIRVGNVKGDAVLETSGGEISAGQIEGTLRAVTGGGDVVIVGAGGSVSAETSGGQIRIGPTGGTVRAQTAGGSIRLQGARGRVLAETAGGGIDLFEVQGSVKASTAAGPILAQFTPNQRSFGGSQLETSMGDIQVFLPPQLALTIDAAIEMAAGHRIVSDFPLKIQGDQDEFAPREIRGHGAVNGGGEVLQIRTVNGNIEIRKLDSRTLEQLKERREADWQRWQARQVERERRRQDKEERRRARHRDWD